MSSPQPLPRHWSPEQAMAVYEFLQLLSEQLWLQYRADFVELLGEQALDVLQPANLHAGVDQHQLPLALDGFDQPDNDYDLPF